MWVFGTCATVRKEVKRLLQVLNCEIAVHFQLRENMLSHILQI